MKTIVGKRGTGKTTRLIEEAAAAGLTIVCSNFQMCMFIEQLARKKGLLLNRPITYDTLLRGELKGFDRTKVAIDDADQLFRRMIQRECDPVLVTFNADEIVG